MDNLYVVQFEHQMEIMDQEEFNHFLDICVKRNKDITTFSVIDLSRKPVSIELVPKICGLALLQKNINLCGGAITGNNFDQMYLYEDSY